ncbi:hypothetical protein C8Q74DRAFT_1222568 [Fomes fomentarius]|nr:hypothetical protein C8Q74DRAFT_1222568 [Fomes fomentarius]
MTTPTYQPVPQINLWHRAPNGISLHYHLSISSNLAHKSVNPAPPPDARRFLVQNPTRILSSESSRDWSLDPAVGRVGGRAAHSHLDTSNQGQGQSSKRVSSFARASPPSTPTVAIPLRKSSKSMSGSKARTGGGQKGFICIVACFCGWRVLVKSSLDADRRPDGPKTHLNWLEERGVDPGQCLGLREDGCPAGRAGVVPLHRPLPSLRRVKQRPAVDVHSSEAKRRPHTTRRLCLRGSFTQIASRTEFDAWTGQQSWLGWLLPRRFRPISGPREYNLHRSLASADSSTFLSPPMLGKSVTETSDLEDEHMSATAPWHAI